MAESREDERQIKVIINDQNKRKKNQVKNLLHLLEVPSFC
jgi:hypothetical protein